MPSSAAVVADAPRTPGRWGSSRTCPSRGRSPSATPRTARDSGDSTSLPPRERAQRSFASGQAVDIDNDGWVDLVLVNRRDADRSPHAYPHVFRNLGTGTFEEVPAREHGLGHGGGGRDLCCGDLDGDGRIDVVINDGSVGGYEGADNTRVYLNRLETGIAWIGLNVTASVKGSPAIGSRVEVRNQGATEFLGVDEVRTDFCYRSKRSPVLHLGLGQAARVDVRVVTRYGQEKVFRGLEAGRVHLLLMAD